MKIKHFFVIAALSSIVIACKSDDGGDTPPEETITEQQTATIEILTEGLSETWKISNASLTNANGTFDISNHFNITDDEFIFSAEGSLEWRIGHDINTAATSTEDAKLDYYRSSNISSFNFNADSGNELTAINGDFTLTVVDDNTVNGAIAFDNGAMLAVSLTQKLAEDYPQIPVNGLTFTDVNTFQSIMVVGGAIGMTGSNATNSLYVVTREDSEGSNGESPEKIFKLSLDNNTFQERLFFQQDFVTKRPYILNGNLSVYGAQYVNSYDQELQNDPSTMAHGANSDNDGIGLTRFGAAVQDDYVYLTGGDLDGLGNTSGNKIRKFDNVSGQIQDFATLPESRYWAGTEIVNDNLYVFGGKQNFVQDYISESTSYLCDLNSGTITSFELPVALFTTFVVRQGDLIYVAGQIREDLDGDENIDNFDIYLGVYDTVNNTMTEISTDLDDSDAFTTIYGMTIFNDKLYVVYGDASQPQDVPNGIIPTWQIKAANIN
ncbi:MAG: hypothetical protein K0U54_09860 [Bacteroidetes bacterium]|nr:hypothetical protein [Bacteroidota bacterium]